MNTDIKQPGRAFKLPLLAGLVLGLLFPAIPQAAPPGRLLVQTRAGFSDAEFDALLAGLCASCTHKPNGLGIQLVTVPTGAEHALAQKLARHPHIKSVEQDRRVPMGQFVPNDPLYRNAWHLTKIQAPTAWDMSAGNGITVAVIDTGVDATHPDLAQRMVPGWNMVSNNNDTSDISGHGTAVAGTVVASTNNAIGVAAVAWGAKLMPIRITNDSSGFAYWSDIANGLIWAADHGAKVANISYGISASDTITSAAQYMRNKGGVVVAAAMNDGAYLPDPDNPYIVTVSATDSNDAKASWSNYGPAIDVAAPGLYIPTTMRGGQYGNWSGTSFASPIAAGVVAMIMQANPSLAPDEVEQVLKTSADDPVAEVDYDPRFGYGRVNAAKAIQLAAHTTQPDTQPPSVAISTPAAGSAVKGTVPVTVTATDNIGVTQVVLYAGGQQVGIDTVAPYQFSWDSTLVPDGSTVLSAYAYDAANNEGVSSLVTVNVGNTASPPGGVAQPVVSFTSPANGSVVSGTVTIGIQVADSAQVTRISLYIDGSLRAMTSNNASLAYNWNTQYLKAGKHTVRAVAADANGKSGELSITVTR